MKYRNRKARGQRGNPRVSFKKEESFGEIEPPDKRLDIENKFRIEWRVTEYSGRCWCGVLAGHEVRR